MGDTVEGHLTMCSHTFFCAFKGRGVICIVKLEANFKCVHSVFDSLLYVY